jgi:hypothetical protein
LRFIDVIAVPAMYGEEDEDDDELEQAEPALPRVRHDA